MKESDKMKKGFTLIEVLATFSIVLILMMIIIPTVTSQIKKSKETALTTQISLIEKAASNYVTEHPEKLDEYALNSSYVTIEQLQDGNYLEKSPIKNPVTKKVMQGCVVISYENATDSYTYKYSDTSCATLKSKTKELVPAYQTIVEEVGTVTTGDGLYEIDDEYVFRGSDPDNYLSIDGTMYRIISLNKKEKTMKVIVKAGESKMWQESTKQKDYSYRLSSVFTYLNTNFYQTLSESLKNYVVTNSTWYTGTGTFTDMSVLALKGINQKTSLNSNVGLLSAYEYARVSLNTTCQKNALDSSCYGKNYLSTEKRMWLLNSEESKVWFVDEAGTLTTTDNPTTATAYPVLVLKANITITGLGTKDEPYQLSV